MAQTWHYRCPLCGFVTVNNGNVESGVLTVRKHSIQAHGATWANIAVRSYERTEGGHDG